MGLEELADALRDLRARANAAAADFLLRMAVQDSGSLGILPWIRTYIYIYTCVHIICVYIYIYVYTHTLLIQFRL